MFTDLPNKKQARIQKITDKLYAVIEKLTTELEDLMEIEANLPESDREITNQLQEVNDACYPFFTGF